MRRPARLPRRLARYLQAESDRLGDEVERLELALVQAQRALTDERERADRAEEALRIARMGALPVVAGVAIAVAGGVRQ